MKGLRKILRVSWTAKKTKEWVLNKAGVKRELLDTVKARKLAYYGHTVRKRELHGERDNARNNVRCTQARKATHGLYGQHQDVDRTLRGRVNQSDRGQGQMEKVRPWCGQPSNRGRLKNRTELFASRTKYQTEQMRVVGVFAWSLTSAVFTQLLPQS